MSQMSNVNSYLRRLRVTASKTQMEVATFLGHTTAQYVSNYERGLCGVGVEQAAQIVQCLGGNIDTLKRAYVNDEVTRVDLALVKKVPAGPKPKAKR